MARVIVLVIDGFGIGHAPDAADFGDVSANTFANLAKHFYQHEKREINLTNLAKMGLVQAAFEAGKSSFPIVEQAPEQGAYGYAAEISTGKDTPSGHWEMMGVPVLFDWGYFPKQGHAFPAQLIEKINQATGYDGILGD